MRRPMFLLLGAALLLTLAVCAVVIAVPLATLPGPECPLNAADTEAAAEVRAALAAEGRTLLCIYDDYGRLAQELHVTQPTATPRPAPTLAIRPLHA